MMLDRIDVHCSWVSQAVLKLLPEKIPDVPGGDVIRDPGPGVFCDNAIDMVMDLWPKPGREDKARAVKSAMKELNKVGLVGMHDAGVTADNARLYSELADAPDWTVRVYSMLECAKRNTFCPSEAPRIAHQNGMFGLRSVKLFAGESPQPPKILYNANLSVPPESRWSIGQLGKCHARALQ